MSTASNSNSNPGLRWNHPALDAVCRGLPDFGSCLLVAENPRDLETLWDQAATGLVPNAEAGNLRTLLSRWEPTRVAQLTDSIRESATDLLILRVDSPRGAPGQSADARDLDETGRSVNALPCALIMLANASPTDWTRYFEVRIVFTAGKARISYATDPTRPQELPCELHAHLRAGMGIAPQSAVTMPAEATRSSGKATLGAEGVRGFGLDAREKRYLARLLELGDIPDYDADAIPHHAVLILKGSLEDEATRKTIESAQRAYVPIVSLGSGILREEDRPKMHAAGARSVLPRNATVEELGAAVLACLPNFRPSIQLASAWEQQMDKMLERMPRGQIWRRGDQEKVQTIYEPLIAHQLERANQLGFKSGALVIDLPAMPPELGASAWAKIMKTALINTLTGALRARDVSFMLDQQLVVLSHNMSTLAARAVIRRIQELMPDAPGVEESWSILSAPPSTSKRTGAAELIQAIFEEPELGISYDKDDRGERS